MGAGRGNGLAGVISKMLPRLRKEHASLTQSLDSLCEPVLLLGLAKEEVIGELGSETASAGSLPVTQD